jgi:hypothetical protein
LGGADHGTTGTLEASAADARVPLNSTATSAVAMILSYRLR